MHLTETNCEWIPDRVLKATLLDAGLFDATTMQTLWERARAGLLFIKAKRVEYSVLYEPRVCHDDYVIPVSLIRGLIAPKFDLDKRTLRCDTLGGTGFRNALNFIAFDLEFSQPETTNYFDLPQPKNLRVNRSPSFSGRFQPYLEEMHRLITEQGFTRRQASISCARMDGIHVHTNAAEDSIAAMLRTEYAKLVRK